MGRFAAAAGAPDDASCAPISWPPTWPRGLRAVYTVYGDEPLLAQEAADAIRAAARAAGHTERQVLVVSGAHFDWSSVLGGVAGR